MAGAGVWRLMVPGGTVAHAKAACEVDPDG